MLSLAVERTVEYEDCPIHPLGPRQKRPSMRKPPASNPTSASATGTAADISDTWNLACVTLVVEKRIFSLSKAELLESPYFQSLLDATPDVDADDSDATVTKGRATSSEPIVLRGIRAVEMDALCRVLYSKGKPVEGYDDWMNVLHLAHKWHFEDARSLAIANLTTSVNNLTARHRLRLGREYQVTEWILSALTDIITQTSGIDLENLTAWPYSFSLSMAARILSVRAQAAIKAGHYRNSRCAGCTSRTSLMGVDRASYDYPEWDAMFQYHARLLVERTFHDEFASLPRPEVVVERREPVKMKKAGRFVFSAGLKYVFQCFVYGMLYLAEGLVFILRAYVSTVNKMVYSAEYFLMNIAFLICAAFGSLFTLPALGCLVLAVLIYFFR